MLEVTQPAPLSGGQASVTPQTAVAATEEKAKNIVLDKGATVEQLVRALHAARYRGDSREYALGGRARRGSRGDLMDSQPIQTTTSEAALLATPSPSKPKTPLEAAKQFEALLIAQMLRTARESMADGGSDSTAETMFDAAGQQFAQMLANGGGFGLSKSIESGLGSAAGQSQ